MNRTQQLFVTVAIALGVAAGATAPAMADNHQPAPPTDISTQDNHQP